MVWAKVPQGSTLIFADTGISIRCVSEQVNESSHAENQLYPSTRIVVRHELNLERGSLVLLSIAELLVSELVLDDGLGASQVRRRRVVETR